MQLTNDLMGTLLFYQTPSNLLQYYDNLRKTILVKFYEDEQDPLLELVHINKILMSDTTLAITWFVILGVFLAFLASG